MHHEHEWFASGNGLNEAGHCRSSSITEANKVAACATLMKFTALGAAQLMASLVKRTGTKLGGIYVNCNLGAMNDEPTRPRHTPSPSLARRDPIKYLYVAGDTLCKIILPKYSHHKV